MTWLGHLAGGVGIRWEELLRRLTHRLGGIHAFAKLLNLLVIVITLQASFGLG